MCFRGDGLPLPLVPFSFPLLLLLALFVFATVLLLLLLLAAPGAVTLPPLLLLPLPLLLLPITNLRPLKPRRPMCGEVGVLPFTAGKREAEPDGARNSPACAPPWCVVCEALPWLLVIDDVHFRFEVELSDHRLREWAGANELFALIGVKPNPVAACATDHRHDEPLVVLSGDGVGWV